MMPPPPRAFVTSLHCRPSPRRYASICVKKGKTCGSSYVLPHGFFVIYDINDGMERASYELPGFVLCCVDHLNLLQLAPGNHIWSQSALDALDVIYGATDKSIPEDLMANADLARIINSGEVRLVLNPAQRAKKK